MKSGFGEKAQTVWLDCAIWGKKAEGGLPEYLKKGQQVAVSGELSTFDATNGKTYLKLRCNDVDLIGGKSDAAPQYPAQSQPQAAAPAPTGNLPDPVTDFDDDIPF
jgi:single-strand DNA-binding protein